MGDLRPPAASNKAGSLSCSCWVTTVTRLSLDRYPSPTRVSQLAHVPFCQKTHMGTDFEELPSQRSEKVKPSYGPIEMLTTPLNNVQSITCLEGVLSRLVTHAGEVYKALPPILPIKIDRCIAYTQNSSVYYLESMKINNKAGQLCMNYYAPSSCRQWSWLAPNAAGFRGYEIVILVHVQRIYDEEL